MTNVRPARWLRLGRRLVAPATASGSQVGLRVLGHPRALLRWLRLVARSATALVPARFAATCRARATRRGRARPAPRWRRPSRLAGRAGRAPPSTTSAAGRRRERPRWRAAASGRGLGSGLRRVARPARSARPQRRAPARRGRRPCAARTPSFGRRLSSRRASSIRSRAGPSSRPDTGAHRQSSHGPGYAEPRESASHQPSGPESTEAFFAALVPAGLARGAGGGGAHRPRRKIFGGRPHPSWLVFAWVSDGEAARLHIRTNSRTIMMPMVLRIVIDTVTSGSAAKG